AAELGYAALGLTDGADLGGIIRFALEAERQGIRPVIGAELVVDGHPAAFLAMNAEGYRRLAGLVTRARVGEFVGGEPVERERASAGVERSSQSGRRGHPYEEVVVRPRGRPRVTWADVAERSEGLFALTGPATGELAWLVRTGRPEEAA